MSNTITRERTTDVDPNPDKLTFLPIDPFAAKRNVASRIAGLGGNDPGDESTYVFQSLEIFPVLGPVPVHFTFPCIVSDKRYTHRPDSCDIHLSRHVPDAGEDRRNSAGERRPEKRVRRGRTDEPPEHGVHNRRIDS